MARKPDESAHPTLRAQWLGHRMRQLRAERGLSLAEAAEYLGIDASALARFERADWPFRREHILALLDRYHIRDSEIRGQLVRQQEEQWRVDIFDTELTSSIHDQNGPTLTWLEYRAELIGTYVPMVLPGLLQTPAYAEAVMRLYGTPENVLADRVERRLARQRVLVDPRKPVRFSTVIEETALRHPVGPSAVMHDQLNHLVTVGRRPNVEIRVLPPGSLRPVGSWGQFTVIRLPKSYPPVGFLENIGGLFYFEAPRSHRFLTAYDQLRKTALPPGESAELIAAVAKEWS